MKILINDFTSEHHVYKNIFSHFGYEENELIFVDSFFKSKEFITQQLETKKLHIDLIITNDDSQFKNILDASQLAFFKNSLNSSYSKNNFRISSIPIILYSDEESKENLKSKRFDSVIQKNKVGNHIYFISEIENQIKKWRKKVIDDLEILEILNKDLNRFYENRFYKTYYKNTISNNSINYFALKTSVVSEEFIKLPVPLVYDWFILQKSNIEKIIQNFNSTFNNHLKYDRKNNERTVLHDFFQKNKLILLREAYVDFEYEKNLYDLGEATSEECDYVLKTEFPEFLKTTFFEVKKEDVTFYVKKNTKRPQISSNYLSHLEQVWRYKEYSDNVENNEELAEKLGYTTSNYNHILLAGRLEEKLEMKDKFDNDLNRMYNGIDVVTYEELENINIQYLKKFERLSID